MGGHANGKEPAPLATWEPVSASGWRTFCGRVISIGSYPVLFPFAVFSHCDATVENARWWSAMLTGFGLVGTGIGHTLVAKRWSESPWKPSHFFAHLGVFLTWDTPMFALAACARALMGVFGADRKDNRLIAGKLHGPNIVVIGNGPSALEGEAYGDNIDAFDEVVRFNNFQTKVAGMERFVGTKTTVHFSDGVLYPSYKEYHVPGATVMLSLFVDRLMVAGTYVIMRGGADLLPSLTLRFLMDPDLSWIEKASIERLKKALGLTGVKHPTSGMLAIDYFINKPGVKLPVYIHGFDFFQGPKMHYFDEHEPWYERLNDRIGVNMHSPHKEKVYVEKLIAEGKVRFLKDKPR
mmetsp:Transcript_5354/g.13339  ORF Transcript_5354/g.13339 Transcript_5354/m.13339 type:complete len:351 (+) Transcript_5354:62-1114(+)|eukprot:CAMPEP_0117531110 /NCGR_PEP_ID=MMETSP0784-20121206/38692_1 /TAXON_ID=39447 /ORGANISM="" /LENGTH=350 /DNA_ID=CAMNT_0005327479 /DNA_START=62 /DNA_END=1114 /DNA_ORIENTATION=-